LAFARGVTLCISVKPPNAKLIVPNKQWTRVLKVLPLCRFGRVEVAMRARRPRHAIFDGGDGGATNGHRNRHRHPLQNQNKISADSLLIKASGMLQTALLTGWVFSPRNIALSQKLSKIRLVQFPSATRVVLMYYFQVESF
jgi:hypothetical protein